MLLSVLVIGCQSTDAPAGPIALAPLEIRIYNVLGMDGPGYHGSLEACVNKLEPVQDAQADGRAQQLTVFVRPNTVLDDETVFEAIRRAGFTPGKRLE